jgi:hypothetical protein
MKTKPKTTARITPNFRQPAKPKNLTLEPPVSDARIEEWVNERSPSQIQKLDKLTARRTRAMGYASCREGSRTWEQARRDLIAGLIRSETDIDEIEIPGKE